LTRKIRDFEGFLEEGEQRFERNGGEVAGGRDSGQALDSKWFAKFPGAEGGHPPIALLSEVGERRGGTPFLT
jgi:hypothetical protein